MIRRQDGVADRPSVAVDEKEAIAVAGQATAAIVDASAPDEERTLRATSQAAAHIASGSRSRKPGADAAAPSHGGDRAFGAARVVERRLDGGAACVKAMTCRRHARRLGFCVAAKGVTDGGHGSTSIRAMT
ncbi:MAG TPA: hypothetical protein VLW83_16270 [Candidatus Acidoferrales bacterium]|nr:hypothetical protein [Candidatus Acidoferrales bacterium]